MVTTLTRTTEAAPARLTFEQFVEWLNEDDWCEWVDGEVVRLSPASLRHQRLLGYLLVYMKHHVEENDAGELLSAPFLMRLPLRPSGREPDLLFVAKDRMHLFREVYLDGPADLVVEIISPDSRTRDRQEKLAEYERAGVREYWLLDPEAQSATFFGLDEGGAYRALPVEEGVFHSRVLDGFRLKLEWLWRDPLPKLREILMEESA